MKDVYRYIEQIKIRWGDMDALGHINNATYLTYFEIGRTGYFNSIAVTGLWDENHGPILANAIINFRRAVSYPGELEIGVRTAKISRSSFTLEYAIYQGEQLVADGTTVVVWADYKAGRSQPLPDVVRDAIQEYEGKNLSAPVTP